MMGFLCGMEIGGEDLDGQVRGLGDALSVSYHLRSASKRESPIMQTHWTRRNGCLTSAPM